MPPLRIAHRGASGVAPENTLASIRRALEIGVDLVEIDVRASRDGTLFLLHDSGVDRTTNGEGPLNRLSDEAVRQLDAGSWFASQFAGEPIPTLEEAIDAVRGRSLLLIEVKDSGIEPHLASLLRRMNAVGHVVAQSFSAETVRCLRSAEPRLACGLLLSDLPEAPPGGADLPVGARSSAWAASPGATTVVDAVTRFGARIAALSARIVSPALVRDLHRRGIPVWIWTINAPAHLREAMEIGVDAIITDFPDRIAAG